MFHDRSFAAWLEQTCGADLSEQRERQTVGFTLGTHAAPPQHPNAVTLDQHGAPEYDRGTLQDSVSALRWAAGVVCSSRIVRPLALVATVFLLVAAWGALPSAVERLWLATFHDETGTLPLLALALIVLVTLGLAGLTLGLLGLMIVSKPLGDVIVPSAKSALAVGTGVAPWVGRHADDVVVAIPSSGLNTTAFRPGDEQVKVAIETGRAAARDELSARGLGRTPSKPSARAARATSPSPVPPDSTETVAAFPGGRGNPVAETFVTVVGGAGVAGYAVLFSTALIQRWALLAVILGASFLYFGLFACRRASHFHFLVVYALRGDRDRLPGRGLLTAGLVAVSVVLVCLAVITARNSAAEHRREHRQVTVTAVEPTETRVGIATG